MTIAGRQLVPPLAVTQQVIRRQVRGPGQAQVTVDGALAGAVLGDMLAYGVAIDGGQPTRGHRVQRRAARTDIGQCLTKCRFFGGQDIQRKMIGCILRQLGLPAVQQFGAQDEDHHHGHQDQPEGEDLAGSGARLLQQLATAQTPGQPGIAQALAAGLQQQPGEAAQQQRGQRAAEDHGQGHRQVAGELPHQQTEAAQSQPIDQPGATRQRRQLAAQYPQRRYATQPQQGRQRKAKQADQPRGGADQQRLEPGLG